MCSAWTVCTPFTRHGSRDAAEDDPRPSILQLNTKGLTANKISVIEQLAYKYKAFIIVLQETHCITRLPSLNQRRIFHFRGPKLFYIGGLLEGLRRLVSYKLALDVLVTFTEHVVPIHKHITVLNSLDIRNKNSHNETNEKASDEVI